MLPYLLAGMAGALIGFLVGRLLVASKAADSMRLKTQLEERDNRIGELNAALASREAELRKTADERAALDASLATLTDLRAKFESTFKLLAGETLQASGESFANIAGAKIEGVMARENANLEKRREEIEKLVRPLAEDLKRYETHIKEIEKARAESYGGLRDQTRQLIDAQERLRKETANLVHALRHPQTRGRWGELTLRRCAELAGMVEHCDFFEQVSLTSSEDAARRPDMIVRLPAGREIIVDSKVSLSAYLDALEAADEADSEQKMLQHANQVRAHMDKLASKEYVKLLDATPDFVILFLPGESFLSAAARYDATLIEDGMKRGVIIATPSTLVILLQAVAKGWREADIEENARKLCEEGSRLYERFSVVYGYFGEIGKSLDKAVVSYNNVLASISSRLFPSMRKIRDFGSRPVKELSPLDPIESIPRQLDPPDDTAT